MKMYNKWPRTKINYNIEIFEDIKFKKEKKKKASHVGEKKERICFISKNDLRAGAVEINACNKQNEKINKIDNLEYNTIQQKVK